MCRPGFGQRKNGVSKIETKCHRRNGKTKVDLQVASIPSTVIGCVRLSLKPGLFGNAIQPSNVSVSCLSPY